MKEMESLEDYIKQQIKDGYIGENLAPLKCVHCDSTNLENYGHIGDHMGCTEYYVRCKDCKKQVGTWAYGMWEL
jgi:hypothetical protein